MKKSKIEILKAEQFACEYYNIPRQKFIALACERYPLLEHTHQFRAAVRAYDEIQRDMMEVA